MPIQKAPLFSWLLAALVIFPTIALSAEKLDGIVALVNDDVILSSELESETKKQLAQLGSQNNRAPSIALLRPQVLEKLINDKLKLQRADRAGITVTEAEVNEAVGTIAARNNLSLGEFADRIRADGLNYLEIRRSLRDELRIQKVRQKEVDARVGISQREVEDALKTYVTQLQSDALYGLQHILISVKSNASDEEKAAAENKARELLDKLNNGEDFAQLAIAFSDGQNALDGGRLPARRLAEMPELFVAPVKRLSEGQHSDLVSSPNGFHIIRLAEISGDDVDKRQEVRARHILVGRGTQQSGQDPRAVVMNIYKRLQAGEDFAILAAEYSEDKGSAKNGGDLGWREPDVYVPEFKAAVSNLPVGQISKPVVSQFGVHVIQVTDRRMFDEPLELREQKMRQAIYQRKLLEEIDLWQKRIRDEAFVEKRL